MSDNPWVVLTATVVIVALSAFFVAVEFAALAAKRHRLEENLGAVDVELTPDDLREIDAAAARIPVQGERYSEGSQRMIDR